ncbi:MAG: hypothetical protein H0W58_09320 [Acidobacteria bacterium]|jgi:WD40 repeat protein|nr:hypothetical protein [Acidobacteriota bacterium]
MKNTFLKTIGATALAILMLAMFAQVRVSAQIFDQPPVGDGNARALEGSWDSQVTVFNCQTGAVIRTFPAMNTFMQGGTMQEFGIGSGLLRGPGHGVWSYNSGQSFSSNFQFFRFNADGTFAGKQINRRQINVSRFGNSFTATTAAEIYNPAGVLIATGCANEVGTRFEL